jgi:hypothetical protein
MTSTFTNIIEDFVIAPLTRLAISVCLPDATIEQCMLHYFVVKHSVEYNCREMAMLIAKYLSEFDDVGIHDSTKRIIREVGLKRNTKYGVGYPHADGTYHYFKIEKFEESADELNLDLAAVEYAMERMDWTYAMSDDSRVWKAGEKAYKALVQKCKDAGMSCEEAREFQEKFWLSKGYKKPFECMARISY